MKTFVLWIWLACCVAEMQAHATERIHSTTNFTVQGMKGELQVWHFPPKAYPVEVCFSGPERRLIYIPQPEFLGELELYQVRDGKTNFIPKTAQGKRRKFNPNDRYSGTVMGHTHILALPEGANFFRPVIRLDGTFQIDPADELVSIRQVAFLH
jgi:hypothetical protein